LPGHVTSRDLCHLSDAELVRLAVAQVLPGARPDPHWLRMR